VSACVHVLYGLSMYQECRNIILQRSVYRTGSKAIASVQRCEDPSHLDDLYK